MKIRKLSIVLSCALSLAGCGDSGPDVFAEAEALEREGKLEEAAAKFELTCVFAPKYEKCSAADGRAAEARLKAADKAIAEGQFARAERLFTKALVTADDAAAKKVADRLDSEEMTQGLAYERALGRASKRDVAKAMEAIAASKAPVAAQAKAWLDKERPPLLIEAVKAACGPAHEGSCSQAVADMKAAALTGPEAEEAVALAEDEERRIYPHRTKAEGIIQTLGLIANRDAALETCDNPVAVIGWPAMEQCVANDMLGRTAEMVNELRRRRIASEVTWRRVMASIADPALVGPLEERKQKAISDCREAGHMIKVGCPAPKVDVPKPKPAPKKAPKK
jgi:tetratricopeptide (TPR) repeat protein